MHISQKTKMYVNGLISRDEFQKFLDIVNMGSDTRFITVEDAVAMYS